VRHLGVEPSHPAYQTGPFTGNIMAQTGREQEQEQLCPT